MPKAVNQLLRFRVELIGRGRLRVASSGKWLGSFFGTTELSLMPNLTLRDAQDLQVAGSPSRRRSLGAVFSGIGWIGLGFCVCSFFICRQRSRKRGGHRSICLPGTSAGGHRGRVDRSLSGPPGGGRDRKSTPLNSRHPSIPYPPFSFKKKKHHKP